MSGIFITLGSVQRYGGRIISLSRAMTSALSVFAGATAAFSVRIPAGSTYAGPLLRARRSSDNDEQNIDALSVADANGDRWLDTAALLAFVGSSSGFVTTWYDQSGNARHARQLDQLQQPVIVNAGVINIVKGRAFIDSAGKNMTFDRFACFAQSLVASPAVTIVNDTLLSPGRIDFSTTVLLYRGGVFSTWTFPAIDTDPHAVNLRINHPANGQATARKDGQSLGAVASTSNRTLDRLLAAKYQEAIFWLTSPSDAYMSALDSSQCTAFGITRA